MQPETAKDELRVFLDSHPRFREIEDCPPGGARPWTEMRGRGETITLLYHATGTGKTVPAVMDAKQCGGRALFLAHTQEFVGQAAETFQILWPGVTVGRYMEHVKEPGAHVVCGSVQSVAPHPDCFRKDAFDRLIVDEAHHAAADTYQKVLAFSTLPLPWGHRHTGAERRKEHPGYLQKNRPPFGFEDRRGAGGTGAGASAGRFRCSAPATS